MEDRLKEKLRFAQSFNLFHFCKANSLGFLQFGDCLKSLHSIDIDISKGRKVDNHIFELWGFGHFSDPNFGIKRCDIGKLT